MELRSLTMGSGRIFFMGERLQGHAEREWPLRTEF